MSIWYQFKSSLKKNIFVVYYFFISVKGKRNALIKYKSKLAWIFFFFGRLTETDDRLKPLTKVDHHITVRATNINPSKKKTTDYHL